MVVEKILEKPRFTPKKKTKQQLRFNIQKEEKLNTKKLPIVLSFWWVYLYNKKNDTYYYQVLSLNPNWVCFDQVRFNFPKIPWKPKTYYCQVLGLDSYLAKWNYISPSPRFPWNKENSLSKPPFGGNRIEIGRVRSRANLTRFLSPIRSSFQFSCPFCVFCQLTPKARMVSARMSRVALAGEAKDECQSKAWPRRCSQWNEASRRNHLNWDIPVCVWVNFYQKYSFCCTYNSKGLHPVGFGGLGLHNLPLATVCLVVSLPNTMFQGLCVQGTVCGVITMVTIQLSSQVEIKTQQSCGGKENTSGCF